MRNAKTFCLAVSVLMLLPLLAVSEPNPATTDSAFDDRSPTRRGRIDIAILLDTSNSMDGLINQARSQLWTIVEQFAQARKYGHSAKLRVALFEYGNTELPGKEGYLRQVVPLSDDLDVLSEALFGLATNGGDEYCGQVIDEAISRLDWDSGPGVYRAIFIAGNEPFTQGPVDYHEACWRAVEHKIVVNTIHCGDYGEGVQGKWKHGARIGKGEFLNINQDKAIVHIPCPQDSLLLRHNEDLNKTYLWYGAKEFRLFNCSNQLAQDSNASSLSSSVAVKRSITKAGGAYDNGSRDLVDGLTSDAEILKSVPEEELPDEMQAMTPQEREAHLQEMAAKRADLKKEIRVLAAQRETFLAQERARRAEFDQDETLGDVVVTAIQKQLIDAGFVMESDAPLSE